MANSERIRPVRVIARRSICEFSHLHPGSNKAYVVKFDDNEFTVINIDIIPGALLAQAILAHVPILASCGEVALRIYREGFRAIVFTEQTSYTPARTTPASRTASLSRGAMHETQRPKLGLAGSSGFRGALRRHRLSRRLGVCSLRWSNPASFYHVHFRE